MPSSAKDAPPDPSTLPPVRLLFRTKTAVELHSLGVPSADPPIPPSKAILHDGPSAFHAFAPDGSAVYIQTSKGVIKRDLSGDGAPSACADGDGPFLANSVPVQFLSVSSKGSYLVTWERPAKTEGGGEQPPPPNLKVWSASTGRYLHGFRVKAVKRDAFPPLRWSHDERYAFYLASNEIHVYPGGCFDRGGEEGGDEGGGEEAARYEGKVRCPGVASFSLPERASEPHTGGTYFLSAFVPEAKGKPARVSLLRYPGGDSVASKSFYRAEECRVRWSPRGDSALAVTAAAVDSSGQSYYGSADLYLLLGTDGRGGPGGGGALSVPLPNNADTVSDARWNPNPSKPPCFCVISGKMPAQSSLHHGLSGDALQLFGTSHRNSVSWSPHGRFLNLGGFGNLAGGMDFWDVNKKRTMPQIDPVTGLDTGARGNTANCAVGYGWSPDGRYFAVSTTSPRMNVDNGVRLYKYNGMDVTGDKGVAGWDNTDYGPDKLAEAEFVPAESLEVYPDRPQTPPPRKSAAAAEAEGGEAPAATAAKPAAAATPAPSSAPYRPPAGRYVPPSARGGGGGTSLADRMRREREGSGAAVGVAKQVKPAGGIVGMTGGKKVPVGMATAGGETKSKSQIKREKAKLAKERAAQAAKEEEERKATEAAAEERARQEANKADPKKRAKKIQKALKRIEELKGKDPKSLDDDQRSKIATEGELRAELASLGL